jgi:CRISPR-associated protein Csh2
MAIIKNRSELVFLYDVKRCNPNGDPLDGNRPRLDEETERCLVTDVRLKRTIRDYLINKGYDGTQDKGDIFVRDVVSGAERAVAYENKIQFAEKFIDVRLFGGVSAPKKDKDAAKAKKVKKADSDSEGSEEKVEEKKTFNVTGPVQFSMGYSLNKITQANFIQGTAAFKSADDKNNKTFREEYNITYGLIAFHGVINENAAKITKTTEEDISELTEAIWNGTKDLLTRSKKGHMPRLLVKIDYKDGFFIGDLCQRLKLNLKGDKKMEGLEDVSDFILDTTELNAALDKYADKITKITVEIDDRLELSAPIRSK